MEALRKKTVDPWKVFEDETPSCILRHKGLEAPSLQDQLSPAHLQLLWERFSRPLTPTTTTATTTTPTAIAAPSRRLHHRDTHVTAHHSPSRRRMDWGSATTRGGGGSGGGGGDGSSSPGGGYMGLEEFLAALRTMPDSEDWISNADRLFQEVDTACEGRIRWGQFCSYILHHAIQRSCDDKALSHALSAQPIIRHCRYNKQEPVIRVVCVSQPPPLRFISVSKAGVLSVWSRHLHLIKTLELLGDPIEGGSIRGKFKSWATDAVFMPNVHKLVVATLSRELRFIDVSPSEYTEELHVFGLSYAVTSMCYWFDSKSPGDRSLLMWGDEKGYVNLLWFHRPLKGLFDIPFSNQEGPYRLYMQELSPTSHLVTYQQLCRVQQGPINGIKYDPHGELIMTSSESATSSVVVMDINLRRESYTWRINKGVTSFDFCPELSMLVTCGLDPAVRLWNRYVTSQPVATLHGHDTTVLDVAIHHTLNKIFSYSKEAVLKIWDIPSQLCVRTLQLRFPCVKPGLTPEHGHFPFLLHGPPPAMLLLTCRDFLGCLHLLDTSADARPTSYTCAMYNPALRMVVTACADSSLVVWDVETGSKTLEVRNAHGEEEVTCMALDHTHRRLLTGATNGTVKMWDLLNGHNLHKMEAVSNTEVTGVVCFPGNRLLTVGWSKQIVQYNIADPNEVYVRADLSWKSGRQHHDDILAVAHCPMRRLLATGSFDGEIIIWSLDTEEPLTRVQWTPPEPVQGGVDGLLFLQGRAQSGQWVNRPLLLSSQAGYICWWSIAGPPHCHGQFYAAQRDGERVVALSSDQENTLLLTGDTAGFLNLWDISQYCLATAEEPTEDRPPLLQAWKAHDRAVVYVELVETHSQRHLVEEHSQRYLLSAASDGTARLWTSDGVAVGTFGQEVEWRLDDPSTYQNAREDESKQTSEAEEEEEDEEDEEEEEAEEQREEKAGTGMRDSQSEARRKEAKDDGQVHRASMTQSEARRKDDGQVQRASVTQSEARTEDDGQVHRASVSQSEARREDDGQVQRASVTQSEARTEDDGQVHRARVTQSEARREDDGEVHRASMTQSEARREDDGQVQRASVTQSEARREDDGQVQRASVTQQRQKSNERGEDLAVNGKAADSQVVGYSRASRAGMVSSHSGLTSSSKSTVKNTRVKNTPMVSPTPHTADQLQGTTASESRQSRRQTYGRIDPKKLNLMDNLCTPFQTLIMPELSPVSELPRRPQMLERVRWFSSTTTLASPLNLSSNSMGSSASASVSHSAPLAHTDGSGSPSPSPLA